MYFRGKRGTVTAGLLWHETGAEIRVEGSGAVKRKTCVLFENNGIRKLYSHFWLALSCIFHSSPHHNVH